MIIISINVYQKPSFLLYQLENIREHVQSPYRIILNCNDTMFNELQDLPENVVKNPEVINKRRFHGSLVHGIYSNMIYALDHYTFDYFIVLSSRTIFYRKVNVTALDIAAQQICAPDKYRACTTDFSTWQWPLFVKTLLAKWVRANGSAHDGLCLHKSVHEGRCLHKSAHEGLCFRQDVIRNIHHFLSDNPVITQDLIVFPACVEEFALQTIAGGDYLYLGHGIMNNVDMSDPNKYTRKINFPSNT